MWSNCCAVCTTKPPAAGKYSPLTPGRAWGMQVDLGKQLLFPPELIQATLRPELPRRSPLSNSLTLGRKGYQQQQSTSCSVLCNLHQSAERLAGLQLFTQLKSGGGALLGKLTIKLLSAVGVTRANQKRTSKEMAEEAKTVVVTLEDG